MKDIITRWKIAKQYYIKALTNALESYSTAAVRVKEQCGQEIPFWYVFPLESVSMVMDICRQLDIPANQINSGVEWVVNSKADSNALFELVVENLPPR